MHKIYLKIADGVSLPGDLVTQSITILAKRRVGKSYTMKRIWEQLLKANQHAVVVDPKGDQWGIRSSADGKSPGFPVLILGGEHGDLPLEKESGELIARLVVEQQVNILLDTSHFSKTARATFMASFLENLYRLKAQEKYRTPLCVIIDEADEIAPQRPQKGEERMLGAIDDIVRRGGQRGLGSILVTQRSASLNKNVLTQSEMLILLRTIAPQDLAAVKAWIDVHGTPEQQKIIMSELPSLPRGDAYFWSPAWPTEEGMFKRAHVLPVETFDSAKTPEVGERRIIPKNLADVDLDALKGQMSATIEKARTENPAALRKEIARLTAELTKKVPEQRIVATKIEKIEVPAIGKRSLARLEQVVKQVRAMVKKSGELRAEAMMAAVNMNTAVDKLEQEMRACVCVIPISASDGVRPGRPEVSTPPGLPHHKDAEVGIRPPALPSDASQASLSKASRLILTYLHSVYPASKSKAQCWVATRYAPGGSFDTAMYALTGAGLIIKDSFGHFLSCEKHDESLIDPDFDPSLKHWDAKLSKASRAVFHLLLKNIGTNYTKQQLADETGYALGGSFDTAIYALTGKDLVERYDGGYRINPKMLEL